MRTTNQEMDFCATCNRQTLHILQEDRCNHILHLLLSVFTIGFWIPIWILAALSCGRGAPRCTICGTKAKASPSGGVTAVIALIAGFGILLLFNGIHSCGNSSSSYAPSNVTVKATGNSTPYKNDAEIRAHNDRVLSGTSEPTATPHVNQLALTNGKYIDAQSPAPTPTPASTPIPTPNSQPTPFVKRSIVRAITKQSSKLDRQIALIESKTVWSRNPKVDKAADEDFKAVMKAMKSLKITPSQEIFTELCKDAQVSYPDSGPTGWTYRDSFTLAYGGAVYDAQPKATKEAQEARAREGLAGQAPETDGMWGVSLLVHDAIKKVLDDPDSYKYISVSTPWETTHNGKSCWLEKVRFRAKNSFGGYVVGTASVWLVVIGHTGSDEQVLDVALSSQDDAD
jgi:hypothetical protein